MISYRPAEVRSNESPVADHKGHFLAVDGPYVAIDRITKEDLLRGGQLRTAVSLDRQHADAERWNAHGRYFPLATELAS
jgi:hypothetical protein